MEASKFRLWEKKLRQNEEFSEISEDALWEMYMDMERKDRFQEDNG